MNRRDIVWLEPIVEVEVPYSDIMQGRLRDPVLRAISSESSLKLH